jgi:N-acetylmuramoyl-L-alanine amidase
MVKIAFDAGHGIKTPGKRTPDDEREWSFNDMVVRYAIVELKAYENVEVLRVDDFTGLTDTPLAARVNQANNWKADAYVSVHHNAFKGVWGNHTGTETFIYPGSSKSRKLAEAIHPQIIKKFKLADRGIKEANFQVLRGTNMPSVLTEGGYMDSKLDIIAMRDESRLKAQAEGIVLGLANYFGLKKKGVVQVAKVESTKDATPSPTLAKELALAVKAGITDGSNPTKLATREEVAVMIYRATKK